MKASLTSCICPGSGQVAKWTLSAAGILYHDMYAANLVGTHVEMRSLEVRPCRSRPPAGPWPSCSGSDHGAMQELLSKKQPKLFKHLQALSCDMSIIATDWFLCLFSTSLPAEVGCQADFAVFA